MLVVGEGGAREGQRWGEVVVAAVANANGVVGGGSVVSSATETLSSNPWRERNGESRFL